MDTVRTVAELAKIVGGEVLSGDRSAKIRRVMPTDGAADDAVTFVSDAKYYQKLEGTRAAAVMLDPAALGRPDLKIPAHTAVIGVAHPYQAFALAAQAFAGKVPGPVGVHPSAVVDASAVIGELVAIGPFVYIGPGAKIGAGTTLYPGAHVEAGASVGPGSILYNNVVIRHGCRVGARCILHPGVVIGSDGFGFALDTGGDSEVLPVHAKIPQTGDVSVEDDVEIGSNSCIDRAALGTTRIGAGTKIDNLVQVGHNVQIEPGCILIAQSGVAGSTKLGKKVIVGPQVGITGHLNIGAGTVMFGRTAILGDVEPNQEMMGYPGIPKAEWFRSSIRFRQLDSLFKRVKQLERSLAETLGKKS